ncbi:MAG: Bor/Iss family lipoprotein [Rhodothermales bacterium]
MRKKVQSILCMALFVFGMMFSSGCMLHTHVVGSGASQGDIQEARQWYILWGLVPINEVDTADMTTGSSNYVIETQVTPLDFVINIFTGIVTVYSRSVTVTK